MAIDAQELRQINFQEFVSDAGLPDLIQQVEGFVSRGGDESASDPKPETDQARLLDWRYQADGGSHYLVLIYTE